ncbi:MAG: 30S ribosomal protein S3ae [Candidatus Heimdallarchaeaceae archaeon]
MSSRKGSRKGKGKKSKVVDKWKMKSWYEVLAPSYVIEKSLGETPADDVSKLYGRVIEMSKLGVSNDLFYDLNLKLRFKITKVEGNICKTEFVGHEVAKEQIRSQIRRNRSKVETIQNVTTKDKAKLRVSSVVITPMRCGTSTKKVIRKVISEIVDKRAKENTFVDYVKLMISGKLAEEIKEAAKKIYPTILVDVRKSKVLSFPQQDKSAAS